MASSIDDTKPANGVLASKADFRANFGSAKSEIELLQDLDIAVRNALGLGPTDDLIPQLGGVNTPTGAQNLPTIILALDAAIEVVRALTGAGGGGPISLGDITDILTPTEAIRAAFANPLNGATQQNNFTFDLGSQGGRFITMDNSLNSVAMTLPDTSVLSARDDGFLCSAVLSSGANPASIIGPAGALRFQRNFFGDDTTQTQIFVGLSRGSGFSSVIHIYKDGPVYRLVGPGRVVETDDDRFGAPATLNANVLQTETLLADAFPTILNLGGSKVAGGARSIVRSVGGTTNLAQTDAGNIVRLTGNGAATWGAPDLAEGTVIEVRSKAGAGAITFNPSGSLVTAGGLTLASGASGAVRYYNDEIEFLGTI